MTPGGEPSTADPRSAPAPVNGPLRAFQRLGRSFVLLWTALVTSNLGTGLRLTVLPLLAGRITADPVAISFVSVAAGLPWLLLSLPGGVIVDRIDRRRLMIRALTVQASAVLTFAIWVAVRLPPLGVIYALVFILTACEVFVAAAWPSLVPRLVGKQRLREANGLLFAGQHTAAQLIGPPLGGLIATLAIAVAFFADAASYLVAALLLVLIQGRFGPDSAAEPDQPVTSVRRSAGEGLRWVWHNRFVRYLMISYGVANLTRAMTTSIFVLFAVQILHLNAMSYGVLLATVSVGALAGSFAAGKLRRFDEATIVVAAMVTHGAATAVMGVARNAVVVGVASLFFGLAAMVWDIIGVSAQQRITPDALMGRVMSVDQLVTWGALPLGALIGGLLADRFGLRTPILAGGLVMLTVAALIGPPLFRAMRLESAR